MIRANPVPEATWGAFEYEVEMFIHISVMRQRGNVDRFLKNALVETSLLHIRVLSEVLLGRKKHDDDILLSMLVTSPVDHRLTKALDELKLAYGNKNTVGSPCWEINKRLAHLTSARGSGYDYSGVFETMEPALKRVLALVAEITARPRLRAADATVE